MPGVHVDRNSIQLCGFLTGFYPSFSCAHKNPEFTFCPLLLVCVFPLEVRGTHLPKDGVGGLAAWLFSAPQSQNMSRPSRMFGFYRPSQRHRPALNQQSLQMPRKPGCVLGA